MKRRRQSWVAFWSDAFETFQSKGEAVLYSFRGRPKTPSSTSVRAMTRLTVRVDGMATCSRPVRSL